jgi:hypothetical protein
MNEVAVERHIAAEITGMCRGRFVDAMGGSSMVLIACRRRADDFKHIRAPLSAFLKRKK